MKIGIIPAKGQSSRLPNKNMALINGRPMLEFTIDYARQSKLISRLYVSTEDEAIAIHCRNIGIDVIKRDSSLCGETPIIEVYRDAFRQLNEININVIVGLQPDHPDRVLNIDEVIKKFEDENADQLISKEADGTKNGAHYILSKAVLEGAEPKNISVVIDNCTNVHFEEDLEKASKNLSIKKILA